MSVLDEVLRANEAYAGRFGDRAGLPAAPARRLAVLTCMDARLDPAAFAGLHEGDAHVVRNAGGRAGDDAIRSLLVSHWALGTTLWLVVHHTECGMEGLTAAQMADAVAGRGMDRDAAAAIDWLGIDDREGSVVEDVRRLREHPLVPETIEVRGYLYDVRSGRLVEVPASRAG